MVKRCFKKPHLIVAILIVLLLFGCSAEDTSQVRTVSYTEAGKLYCIASSGTKVDIADIVDGGECGEDFARQGDLYDHIGSGSGFSIPPQEADCITQFAQQFSLNGPTFLFILHSLGENGIEIRTSEESAIERRELRADSTCFIDFWVLPDAKEGDVFEIRLRGRTIPVTIGGITSGGVGGFQPINDEIRIGRP